MKIIIHCGIDTAGEKRSLSHFPQNQQIVAAT